LESDRLEAVKTVLVDDLLCLLRSVAVAVASQDTGGTYGNVLDGLRVTDSLPMPRRIGVLAAVESITSGALSVSARPFHSAKPNEAGVPTVGGSTFGKN
jgi:hypothetical protein